MPNHLIRRLAILGAIAVIGIVLVQGMTLIRSYDLEANEFDQTVRVALYQVAERLAINNGSRLPKQNLVQRKSSNYYAVNINDIIDANILEDYLIQELESSGINTDFEYAVYDCQSQDMVYGNDCKLSDLEQTTKNQDVLPKFNNLIYYFVVGFPSRKNYLLSNIWQHILYGLITILALTFFAYSMWVILQQKKLSELQKDFINNMTHEFKTPISSIKIAANVINSDPYIQGQERLRKYGQIIIDQNDRLNEQVEKVLNLARMERENFRLNKSEFDIVSLVKDIAISEDLKVKEQGKGKVVLATDLDVYRIKADKLHLSNVLHNIIDNAVKYCPHTPQVKIDMRHTDDGLDVAISDNGIGIEKEYIPHLFKKFYRIPTGNVHDVKGFGLGLYYVHHICEAHGWKLDVYSEPKLGTTITISIHDHV